MANISQNICSISGKLWQSLAKNPGHRRVIHLEYASELLPDSLQWLVEDSFR
jgi:hypothetical protein